jgi:hypothetical protein
MQRRRLGERPLLPRTGRTPRIALTPAAEAILSCRIPGRCWTSAFSVERVLCRMRFVVPVVTPVASHAGEGDQQEPRPGRSGCRRDLRSTSRSSPTARLPVPALSGLRPQPAGRARRECRGPGSRSSPTARAGRPRARRPQVAPARGRTPARDRPVARTPGRRSSRAGHGRSAGCGPGRWAQQDPAAQNVHAIIPPSR